jgi:hypothetical protein
MDETTRVFNAIREAKPSKLYIASDGARKSKQGEKEQVEQIRELILGKIDWECNVQTLFRDDNLGCKQAVSSAIDWFFQNEERGIILEDDCLPHPSFFTFCETMLDRYQNDTRIVHIGGANFQDGIVREDGDYYFSRLTHVWGWASWRRAWKSYDIQISKWIGFKKANHLFNTFPDQQAHALLSHAFDQVSEGLINTWDYQLLFSNLASGGLSIIPNVNLVSNIGFSSHATHTAGEHPHGSLPSFALTTFREPSIFLPCLAADLYTLRKEAGQKSVGAKIKGIFKSALRPGKD